MAKRPKNKTLTDAQKYYQLLLYEASGGLLGTEPTKELKQTNTTFAEKRGLLDTIVKIAQFEDKSNEDEEQPSGLDILRKGLANERRESASRRDSRGTGSEDTSDESESDASTAS